MLEILNNYTILFGQSIIKKLVYRVSDNQRGNAYGAVAFLHINIVIAKGWFSKDECFCSETSEEFYQIVLAYNQLVCRRDLGKDKH